MGSYRRQRKARESLITFLFEVCMALGVLIALVNWREGWSAAFKVIGFCFIVWVVLAAFISLDRRRRALTRSRSPRFFR
jgi:hypothetical protein